MDETTSCSYISPPTLRKECLNKYTCRYCKHKGLSWGLSGWEIFLSWLRKQEIWKKVKQLIDEVLRRNSKGKVSPKKIKELFLVVCRDKYLYIKDS